MLHGLLQLSFWGYVLVTLILTQITLIGVTIYLHRCQSHRALDLHPVVSHFFRFWLWMTTGMVTKEWVAVHRKHHVKCETKDDPHSPQIHGLMNILFKGVKYYKEAARDKNMLDQYGRETPDDWLERKVYSPYSACGVMLTLIIDLLLFGLPGALIWLVQMVWIPFFAAGVINGVGHFIGYRNFECSEAARNIIPVAIFICGEELHNNHHTFPTSAKLSYKWWEFDLGWGYICLLKALGLAKVRHVPPKPIKQVGKNYIDLDTVKAIVYNRFQVMAQYSKEVLKPVLREEVRQAAKTERGLLKRMKKLLVRKDIKIDATGNLLIEKILNRHERLQVVYEYQRKLQELWLQASETPTELLEKLQKWCKQAEDTSIEALKDFSQTLRSYTLNITVR